MTFELLPNEILIECFEYLNAIDIFYSFDFLNSRFYNLIRNIPLYLNIEHVKKSMLIQFCIKISNLEMKKQIMSLKLSKKNMCNVIETFFSFVSLDELSQLRSLTLIDVDKEKVSQISSMLPLLTNLHYFRISDSSSDINNILNSLPTSTIETLSIPRLAVDLTLIHKFTSLINLIVFNCCIEALCYFFKYSPNLQNLSVDYNYQYGNIIFDELRLTTEHAVHLKRLVIKRFEGKFELLEPLLKRTPNLKFFMISADYNNNIVDAWRWQNLITTSLPSLKIFKFIFSFRSENKDSDVLDKFQQFQNDFWLQQNHWYTECTSTKKEAFIYTIPYILNKYEITPYTKRYCNESINDVNTFANVIDLTLSLGTITNSSQYHFANVKSLKLKNARGDEIYPCLLLKAKHMLYLKTIVSLCHLNHLDVSLGCELESSSLMLQLLKEAPYLSSLKINRNTLFSLFDNRELCECLNKMIKKLDITESYNYIFVNFHEIDRLCQIFSNMENFSCNIGRVQDLQVILNQLSKLSHMKGFSYRTPYRKTGDDWLKDHAPELDLYSFTTECQTGQYADNYYDD